MTNTTRVDHELCKHMATAILSTAPTKVSASVIIQQSRAYLDLHSRLEAAERVAKAGEILLEHIRTERSFHGKEPFEAHSSSGNLEAALTAWKARSV